MADDKAKRSSKVEEKGVFTKILESVGYSGAASAKRKREIENQMEGRDAASGVPETPEPNSYQQYLHEKNAGDPNATQMSYEEWKKL